MLDWLVTIAVLSIGFFIMVSGLIEYVFIGFLIFLLLSVISNIILIVKKSKQLP